MATVEFRFFPRGEGMTPRSLSKVVRVETHMSTRVWNYSLSSRVSFLSDLRFYSPHACPHLAAARLRNKRDGYPPRRRRLSLPAVNPRKCGIKSADIDVRKRGEATFFLFHSLVPPTDTLDTPLSTYDDSFELEDPFPRERLIKEANGGERYIVL